MYSGLSNLNVSQRSSRPGSSLMISCSVHNPLGFGRFAFVYPPLWVPELDAMVCKRSNCDKTSALVVLHPLMECGAVSAHEELPERRTCDLIARELPQESACFLDVGGLQRTQVVLPGCRLLIWTFYDECVLVLFAALLMLSPLSLGCDRRECNTLLC